MSTKLETMVGYLSGRDGDPRLLDELADPSSEASRFLESTRERSRALIGGPTVGEKVDRPRPNRFRRLAIAALIAAALVAIGVAYWLADGRLRRLEATLARSEAESRAKDRRLEAALARLADSTPSLDPLATALGRVEVGLEKLERRIESIDRKPEPPSPPKADPSAAEDLATLRREFSAAEKANARQIEDIRASVQDVARLLRLLLGRTQPLAPEPAAVFPSPRPPTRTDLHRGP